MEHTVKKPLEFINFHDFFFKKKFNKRDIPLFKSQIEISEVCINDPSNPLYGKKVATVRSAISQIFTGERNISKNLSAALKKAIVATVKSKVLSNQIIEELEKLLIRLKVTWKDFAKARADYKAKKLLTYTEIEERLKYTYQPEMEIFTNDMEYLLSVIQGSGDKITLGVLMTLLKQRKNI